MATEYMIIQILYAVWRISSAIIALWHHQHHNYTAGTSKVKVIQLVHVYSATILVTIQYIHPIALATADPLICAKK